MAFSNNQQSLLWMEFFPARLWRACPPNRRDYVQNDRGGIALHGILRSAQNDKTKRSE